MSAELAKHLASKLESDIDEAEARALEDAVNENYGTPVYGAAVALAKALELLKADPDYAEGLGISRPGMGFLAGAEATLRAASIGM